MTSLGLCEGWLRMSSTFTSLAFGDCLLFGASIGFEILGEAADFFGGLGDDVIFFCDFYIWETGVVRSGDFELGCDGFLGGFAEGPFADFFINSGLILCILLVLGMLSLRMISSCLRAFSRLALI